MKVRLVAYRKQTTSSSELSQFELDLQKEPNVVVNYNWLDLKDPSRRKSSFSQTVKLPFSNANNKFFENYFDVNLQNLVFNSQKKFNAILYIDSIPQLKGFIQLKSIMLNARLYEVALFGQTADFFTDIKSKKLRDVFTDPSSTNEDEPVIDTSLNHYFSNTNVVKSWTSPGLGLVDGGSTNDIMYPVVDYGHTNMPYNSAMFYDPTSIENDLSYYGAVRTGDLKPAIRLQRLLLLIAQKAGYTIKSTFLGIDGTTQSDTSLFSRLFMTLATETTRTQTLFNTTSGSEAPMVGFKAELTNTTGTLIFTQSDYPDTSGATWFGSSIQHLNAFNEVYDPNNIFSVTTYNAQSQFDGDSIQTPTITFPSDLDGDDVVLSVGTIEVKVDFSILMPNATSDGTQIIQGTIMYGWIKNGIYNTFDDVLEDFSYSGATTFNFSHTFELNVEPGAVYNFFITMMGMNEPIQIYYPEYDITTNSSQQFDPPKLFTPSVTSLTIETLQSEEMALTNGFENGIVSMFHNMPDILQEDFVKDLVNRFNLVIKTDADDEKKLIIEPYQDYVNLGTTQYWTDKIDLKKEQVITTTNDMQSKEYLLKDNEDADLLNNRYFQAYETVYGTYKEVKANEFAKGTFTNFSIMAPFIAQGIADWSNGNLSGNFTSQDVAVAYLFEADEGSSRSVIENQLPKIYYYSGTPITITGTDSIFNLPYKFYVYSNNYNMNDDKHPSDDNDGSANKFPLCTQYNLDSIGSGVTANTKIFNWTWYNPYFNTGFTFDYFGATYTDNGYYNEYWAQYLNELHSDESRIMECHVNLTPQDIKDFAGSGFQNTFFIKNTLWRVLEIKNYLVGGNKSTKVRLIKVIEKLPNDCGAVNVITASGLMTWTDSATGASTTITNSCCEEVNDNWTFIQTNANGTGDCYAASSSSNSGTTFSFLLPYNPPVEPQSYSALIPSNMPTIQNSYATSIGYGKSMQFFCECTTTDNSTAFPFTFKGITSSTVYFPQFVTSYVHLKLTGTVLKGANTYSVGFFEYEIVIKNITAGNDYVGTNGGKVLSNTKDTSFTQPTVNINNFRGGKWTPTVTGGSDEFVFWTAEFNITSSPKIYLKQATRKVALYQNADETDQIAFQNTDYLLWN